MSTELTPFEANLAEDIFNEILNEMPPWDSKINPPQAESIQLDEDIGEATKLN